jgi:hypothetical protein
MAAILAFLLLMPSSLMLGITFGGKFGFMYLFSGMFIIVLVHKKEIDS